MSIIALRRSLCAVLVAWSALIVAQAAEPVVSFETDAQRVRYERLLEEYRCLKCQNQNLAGSNAALAGDLRRQIRERIIDGEDDAAIDDYLVQRYGDFVRYRPRFGGANLVLWIGPFVLLLIGLAAGFTLARRSQRRAAQAPPPQGVAVDEARRLLDEGRGPG